MYCFGLFTVIWPGWSVKVMMAGIDGKDSEEDLERTHQYLPSEWTPGAWHWREPC